MKKIATLLFLLSYLLPLSAQHPALPMQVKTSTLVQAENGSGPAAKVTGDLDTLYQHVMAPQATGYTIYGAGAGMGYVFGTSFDGFGNLSIEATGEYFDSVGNVTVVGVYGWFARKEIIGSPDNIKAELYSAGPDSMPTTLIGYGNLNTAFLDTNVSINFNTLLGFQVFQINNGSNQINEDFLIAINYAGIDDTIGIVSTINGDGLMAKRCRLLTGPSLGLGWVRLGDFWTVGGNPMDCDPVIFPIVEFPDTAASAGQAFHSPNLNLWPVAPNPVVGDPVIRYELGTPDQVQVWVLDAAGRFIYDSGVQAQNAGMHEIRLDGGKLASGIYYYTARTSRGSLTSRFAVR